MEYLEHYSYKQLLKTSFPVVVMLVFTSIYGMVDGLFVSNLTGKSGFTAVNLMMPYLMFFGGIGFIFGRGGSALIAKTLGEKKREKANSIFRALVISSFLTGIVVACIGRFFLSYAADFLGARGEVYNCSIKYGSIFFMGTPFFVIQVMFESLYSTAGKQKMGMYCTIISGVMNILMDWFLIAFMGFGISGAAYATVSSQLLGAIIPIIYFTFSKESIISIRGVKANFRSMIKVCTNGLSEMLNNVTFAIVSTLYNIQLLKYGGNNAVSAYGVMMYVGFFFNSILYGFITAVSPLISYHFGANNKKELKSLLRQSLTLLSLASIIMFTLANLLNPFISRIFVGYDYKLLRFTMYEFKIFSFWFLVNGLAFFGSSFFTALNNGFLSAFLSFARIVVFQIPAVLLIPLFMGIDGIFISQAAAEMCTVLLNMFFIIRYKKRSLI